MLISHRNNAGESLSSSLHLNMWRTHCLTLLPVATAATYISAQRSATQCQSQPLGTGTVDPSAELKLVQVVFRSAHSFATSITGITLMIFGTVGLRRDLITRCRHGARSPLTKRYWAGQEWDVCGKAFEPVAIDIKSIDGGEQPKSGHDQAQVIATVMPSLKPSAAYQAVLILFLYH